MKLLPLPVADGLPSNLAPLRPSSSTALPARVGPRGRAALISSGNGQPRSLVLDLAPLRRLPLLLAACLAPLLAATAQPKPAPPATPHPGYETRQRHDPNGIGKFYLGREIAHVMGHQAADWLERPEREEEERTDLVLPALKLKPGDVVADIGSGTGYFSWRIAKVVGEKGLVYGVEIQQEMLDLMAQQMAKRKVTNVKGLLGTITDPKLPPAAVDLVIMVDVYHEFDHPFEMMANLCHGLKPGGRVVFVEYRGEDPAVPIKLVHKMTEAQVKKEMAIHPLEWVETIKTLPRQHIIIFRKVAAAVENSSPPQHTEKQSIARVGTNDGIRLATVTGKAAPAPPVQSGIGQLAEVFQLQKQSAGTPAPAYEILVQAGDLQLE